mgnify:CR=1 FL=1
MKPSESFLLLTTFAANNISTADENSAAANSFKTIQHLSGSNFLRLLFGIKNIVLIVFGYQFHTADKDKENKETEPKICVLEDISFVDYNKYLTIAINKSIQYTKHFMSKILQ